MLETQLDPTHGEKTSTEFAGVENSSVLLKGREPAIVDFQTRPSTMPQERTNLPSTVFVTVAGNIGSGKTTLTRMLCEKYGWDAHFEVVQDNPYLADFYEDMNRWSLQLQVFFLSKRFQAHQKILQSGRSGIQDRSVYEDLHIFARALHESGRMETRDYENYLDLFGAMEAFLRPPDLMIYIRRSIPKLLTQIKMRGRDYEASIPESYLALLSRCYEEWVSKYSSGPTLIIDAENLDFKNDPKDFDWICGRVERMLAGDVSGC